MKSNYVLIDYENVQPKDLALLKDGEYQVKLFLGPNQSKIPVGLAKALQELGTNAEYVILESAGSNALDFHIAYYIGVLSTAEPEAGFHIISRDTGFDPLIRHLKGKGVTVHRSAGVSDLSRHKRVAHKADDTDVLVDKTIAHIQKRKSSRPATRKTLLSTMRTLFKKELSEERLEALVESMSDRGLITVNGTKVSYDLPE